ncbi:nuclear transport factor 2 family protein [Paraflavitalea soli]|uniref:Nuclear transport factor 2 family protein n=1 Tax=Paraflavitalea soli TaxID=2315862 RepID=A0A3B7MFW2_9BACT|nr:nuclear transport factor 2 family protein [Paraflavitalea soli]AXY73224.1 nuclear transport factor 2 family protein [Paraflavitalea soli]
MDNRTIIQEVIAAFDANNIEGILQHLTDDVTWTMIGDRVISTKEGMRTFLVEGADIKMVSSTKDNIIIEGDRAAVNGEVVCKNTQNGDLYEMFYTDIYELKNGKVNKITSYIINKKK